MRRFILLFLFVFNFSYCQSQESKERLIVNNMIAACKAMRTGTFILKSTERLRDGHLHESEILVKQQTHPRNLYLYCIYPNPGAEALWRENLMEEKMLINPNGFPYVNLKLSPYSALIRKETHHTVHDLGFDYLMSLIGYYSKQLGPDFYSYLNILDTITWEKRPCIRLSFDYTDYKALDYTVKIGENITSIALKLHLNDFSILLLNPAAKNYDDIQPGQVIRIPNFYCRKIVFTIDRTNCLPLKQEVYDESGLYEQYEFLSFVLDPVITPMEFSPDYDKYKF